MRLTCTHPQVHTHITELNVMWRESLSKTSQKRELRDQPRVRQHVNGQEEK